MLAPVVRRAVGDGGVLVDSWDVETVKGDGSPSKRLVCRISGVGRRGGEEVPWSLYLKVPDPTETHYSEWHREPFQREVLLLESGILDDLPGGIAAPRCLGITRLDGDEPWMWLEDVAGLPSLRWPVERFDLTARQFGAMQGAFLAGRPIPDHPWLDTSGWLRRGLARTEQRIPAILERFGAHPLTQRLAAGDLGRRVRDNWARRGPVLDALERLPRSLCHGDFSYTNLFARTGADGVDRTVVVDWQYAGVAQIGRDVAGLIADSSICPVRRKAAEPEEFTQRLLDNWLAGLREAGWDHNPDVPRFACLAVLAWIWGANLLLGLNGVLTQTPSADNRDDLARRVDDYVRNQEFLLPLAEEAWPLRTAVR
jgi:thiamine kinase-like enzyme